jgi:hypothetical protein
MRAYVLNWSGGSSTFSWKPAEARHRARHVLMANKSGISGQLANHVTWINYDNTKSCDEHFSFPATLYTWSFAARKTKLLKNFSFSSVSFRMSVGTVKRLNSNSLHNVVVWLVISYKLVEGDGPTRSDGERCSCEDWNGVTNSLC